MATPPELSPVLDELQRFWRRVDLTGETGRTSWEVLARLRDQVTECLLRSPPDIDLATQITAKALLMMQGYGDD